MKILKNKTLALLVISIISVISVTTLQAKTTTLSANGNPDMAAAIGALVAGDTLLLQAGTYSIPYQSGVKNTIQLSQSGSSSSPIVILGVGGYATLDFSFPEQQWVQDSYGLHVTGDYWYFKNIRITRAGYQGAYVEGAHNTFDNCAFFENRNSGLEINKGGSYTTVINSDAYRNYDPKKNGSMADGFASKQKQGPGNTFVGCRAWENSDDGWDTYDSPEIVTIDKSYTFRNGIDIWKYGSFAGNGNGFKLGGNHVPARNVITRSVSFDHPNKGFDQNNNTAGLTLWHNLSFDNGDNYGLGGTLESGEKHDIRNNISWNGSVTIKNATEKNNSWNLFSSQPSWNQVFASIDTSLATVPRSADGALPQNSFYRLTNGSPFIDAGVVISGGFEYEGNGPDLGPWEYGAPLSSSNVVSSSSIEPSSSSSQEVSSSGEVSSSSNSSSSSSAPTLPTLPVYYWAATAYCEAVGVTESTNPGYMMQEYLNLDNIMQATVRYTVHSESAFTNSLQVRFANGSSVARNMQVWVNQQNQGTIYFPQTGDFSTWLVAQATVSLQAGWNEIELRPLSEQGAPNLDWLGVQQNGMQEAPCTEPSSSGEQSSSSESTVVNLTSPAVIQSAIIRVHNGVVHFQAKQNTKVVQIFDLTGALLFSTHKVNWEWMSPKSGIYFIRTFGAQSQNQSTYSVPVP
jgi:hypothetical protein